MRELAFNRLDTDEVHSWEIDIPFNHEELSPKDKITNDYITRNLTGLTFQPQRDSNHMTSGKIRAFIGHLYQKCQTNGRKYFGIKSEQIAEILFDLDIPFAELDSLPSMKRLEKYYKTTIYCPRHSECFDGTCSDQKIDHIRRWISDSNKFYEEFPFQFSFFKFY